MAQATKKRIMDGFLELLEQRPLDKISVVDIADHCGINRNTFYYYYCDVYALIRELMEVRAQQLITDNQEDLNWIEITREVTSFFRTHRRTVYHLFHSSQRDLLEDHIYDVTYACTESLVRRTASILLGLGALWLWPGWGGVVLWLIWFLLANLPFILIQRYNRPRLMRLHALLQRREQRKGTHEHSDTDL